MNLNHDDDDFGSMFREELDLKGIDLYEVLSVHPKATQKDIKRAYRRKIMDCHPDKQNRNISKRERQELDEEARLLNAVYAILGDETKRRKYDGSSGASFSELRGFYSEAQELDRKRRENEITEDEYRQKVSKLDPEDEDFKPDYDEELMEDFSNKAFNAKFEEAKKTRLDPNEIGYGEYGEDLAERTKETVGVSYEAALEQTDYKKPNRIFGKRKAGGKFDVNKFNYMFEKQNAEQKEREQALIVSNGDGPEGFDPSGAIGYAAEVSSFNGLMIVGSDPSNGFSKELSLSFASTKSGDTLGYSDYMDSFSGAANPESYDDDPQDFEMFSEELYNSTRALNASEAKDMMQKLNDERSTEIEPQQTQEEYYREKKRKLKKEKKKKAEFVKGYASQYKPSIVSKALGGLLESSERDVL